MSGEAEAPVQRGARVTVGAAVPLSEAMSYQQEFAAYTHGRGVLTLHPAGMRLCHNTEAVRIRRSYDAERDVTHTPDSVFCSHGAGYTVAVISIGRKSSGCPLVA